MSNPVSGNRTNSVSTSRAVQTVTPQLIAQNGPDCSDPDSIKRFADGLYAQNGQNLDRATDRNFVQKAYNDVTQQFCINHGQEATAPDARAPRGGQRQNSSNQVQQGQPPRAVNGANNGDAFDKAVNAYNHLSADDQFKILDILIDKSQDFMALANGAPLNQMPSDMKAIFIETLRSSGNLSGVASSSRRTFTRYVPQGRQVDSPRDAQSVDEPQRTSPSGGGDGSESFSGIAQLAQECGARFPALVAAQWALESARGSALAGRFNYFGIKGGGSSQSTQEWEGGRMVTVTASFKDFSSRRESIQYLVDRWYKNYKSYQGVNNASSAEEAARMLVSQRYATDPNYAEKLIQIMQQGR